MTGNCKRDRDLSTHHSMHSIWERFTSFV